MNAIIPHDLHMRAVKQVMLELRADGPLGIPRLRYKLLDQVPGVTEDNLDAVWEKTWAFVTNKRHPMVQEYEMFPGPPGEEPDPPVYEVADRMYDKQGNYKGSE